jgi:hypothetical protein
MIARSPRLCTADIPGTTPLLMGKECGICLVSLAAAALRDCGTPDIAHDSAVGGEFSMSATFIFKVVPRDANYAAHLRLSGTSHP